jgi:CDP-glycerol glycerophosphotransferase
LKIPEDYKVVLYAPTFRKGDNLDVYDLNYHQVLEKLQRRFDGKWVFLVKLHPHLLSKSNQIVNGHDVLDVLDVTSYDDIQELLSIANVLITDYSSLMFDYSITGRPCFLYIPDVIDYIHNDRGLYFDVMELPFISGRSMEELLTQVESFHEEAYQQGLAEFSREIGTFEQGNACVRLLEHVNQVCFSKNRRGLREAV